MEREGFKMEKVSEKTPQKSLVKRSRSHCSVSENRDIDLVESIVLFPRIEVF